MKDLSQGTSSDGQNRSALPGTKQTTPQGRDILNSSGNKTPAAKNAMMLLVGSLLAEVKPGEWNNIPIPIVEGFEALIQAFKKLFQQVDTQLEGLRRSQQRSENDFGKDFTDFKDRMQTKWDGNTRILQEVKDFVRYEVDKQEQRTQDFIKQTDKELTEIKTKKLPGIEDGLSYCLSELKEKNFLTDLEHRFNVIQERYEAEHTKLGVLVEQLQLKFDDHHSRLHKLTDEVDVNIKKLLIDSEEYKYGLLNLQAAISENESKVKVKVGKSKARLREEMEAMRSAILVEMEPIMDARAHMVVGSLFATSKQHVLNTNSVINHIASGGSVMRSPYSSQMGLTPQATMMQGNSNMAIAVHQDSTQLGNLSQVSPPGLRQKHMLNQHSAQVSIEGYNVQRQKSSNITPEIYVHEPAENDEYFKEESADLLVRSLKSVRSTVDVVKKEIDQIFYEYDEQANDKLMDIDGLKLAIKRGLLTVAKTAQEKSVQQVEATTFKFAEIETHLHHQEEKFSTLVHQLGSRTDKLEHIVLQKVLSSHSVGAHPLHESTHKSPSINIQDDYAIEEEGDNLEQSSQVESTIDKRDSSQRHQTIKSGSVNQQQPDEHLKKSVNTLKNAMRLPQNAKSKGYSKERDGDQPSVYKQKLEEMAAMQGNEVDYDGLVNKLINGDQGKKSQRGGGVPAQNAQQQFSQLDQISRMSDRTAPLQPINAVRVTTAEEPQQVMHRRLKSQNTGAPMINASISSHNSQSQMEMMMMMPAINMNPTKGMFDPESQMSQTVSSLMHVKGGGGVAINSESEYPVVIERGSVGGGSSNNTGQLLERRRIQQQSAMNQRVGGQQQQDIMRKQVQIRDNKTPDIHRASAVRMSGNHPPVQVQFEAIRGL
ncbi:hypothetical protein FGO68_gene5403 [Halteria grandinella]|uniref:Uncharacterized protein n=1 Tax=Halteria grandinella TaxID=5974 RepID=A0A8J8NYP7_HALGN|nr:hypothetical protein FGO68_gene5403 [Halteria grandinella]